MASKDGARFDAGNGWQAYRYVVTMHFRDVSANLLQVRSHEELDLLVPLVYRSTKVLLAHVLEDDGAYQAAIEQIDNDASFVEHAEAQVRRIDDDPRLIAARERLWAKFGEMQKATVRNGLLGTVERTPDPTSMAFFEDGDTEEAAADA